MLLRDSIFDLGTDGIFTLSLDVSCHTYGPILPSENHYANWYPAVGVLLDRREICQRKVDGQELREAMKNLATRLSGAVGSVAGRIEWTTGLIAEKNYVHPVAAGYVGAGRFILLFRGCGLPTLLRLVDVVQGEVLHEESYTEIQLEVMAGESYFGTDSRLDVTCKNYFILCVGGKSHLFCCDENRPELIISFGLRAIEDCAMGDGYLLAGSRRSQKLDLFRLDDFTVIRSHESPFSGWTVYYAGCSRPGLFALSHSGGTVELLDIFGGVSNAYRPFPKAGKKEQLQIALEGNGDFILASSYDGCIIDPVRGLMAYVDLPRRDDSDTTIFSGKVDYYPAQIAGAEAIHTVHRGLVSSMPYTDLEWTPAVMAKALKAAGAGDDKQKFPQRLLKKWRKPCVQLIALRGKYAGCRSHLYGVVALPSDVLWPLHEGSPMLLLCNLDMAELATVNSRLGLPKSGSLLIFTAFDSDGNVMDDDFSPLKIIVMYIPVAVSSTASSNEIPAYEPIWLGLKISDNDLPYVDALAVTESEIEDDQIELYRQYLEGKMATPPRPDFHVGGYPAAVQGNDLELQAQGFLETGEPYAYSEDVSASLQWSLLMQFDSDSNIMWDTDMGRLYLMIHKNDLKRLDFSRVVAISAGH